MFLGSKVRPVRRAATLPPYVNRLSRHCGILNISQPYRPPKPVSMIALLFNFLYIEACSRPDEVNEYFSMYEKHKKNNVSEEWSTAGT
jgi:hypothetical protein